MVGWLIGLSGAGKTTLAEKIVADANASGRRTVLLDGDVIREVFGNDLGYTMQDRLLNAKRICQLGKFLHDQGLNVVVAILSIFPETREWNRCNVSDYYEVFVDTPMDVLIKRDSKGIYSRFDKGEISDVAGLDIDFPPPTHADLTIKNDGSIADLLHHSAAIVEVMNSSAL